LVSFSGTANTVPFFMSSTNQLEKEELKKFVTTSDYLNDIRLAYYGSKTTFSSLSPLDKERAFLKKVTGATFDSLHDLWRQYLLAKGVTNVLSLGDMKREFYQYVGFQALRVNNGVKVTESKTVTKS